MTETLVIRMPEDLDAPARWTVVDAAGTRVDVGGEGTLGEAANAADQRDVLVLVPGSQVITTRTNLPVKSASKMLQVAPFALEEQMAGDVSRLHFALGERSSEGDVDVLAVRRDRMEGWVEALDEAGFGPVRMAPDSVGLPAIENGFTVLLGDIESAVRHPDGVICYVDTDSVADALELMTAPAPDDEDSGFDLSTQAVPVTVFFEEDGVHDALLDQLQANMPQLERRRLPNGALPRLAAEAIERQPPSLRQGEFAPRARIERYWAPWRAAVVLLGALLFVAVSFKATEAIVYKNRFNDLRAQMKTVYMENVPGASANEIDPLNAVRALVNGGGASDVPSDFLDGLNVLAGALNGDRTYLEQISFQNNTMSVEVNAPDVSTLDALRQAISASGGWDAALTRTRDKDKGVEGRLQIQRSGQ
ncbi:MAG: type II secretion system protein GspL [Pseudomonadota bacterium]